MNLDERDLKKIKSLHVMLKMPIWILEKETNKVLKSYESIYKHPISYGFKEKNISEETVQFYSGILNEIFLCLWYKDIKIVIGAFRINNVTRADFSHVYNNMDDENKKNKNWAHYNERSTVLNWKDFPYKQDKWGMNLWENTEYRIEVKN